MMVVVCLLLQIVISKFIIISSAQQHKTLSFSFTDLLNIKMLIFFFIYVRV
jgi:uncharacterized protein Veg